MLNSIISVCFITDESYIIPTSVAITSLCMNASKSICYHIYVLTPRGISYEYKKQLLSIVSEFDNINIEILECDISDFEKLHKLNHSENNFDFSAELLKFKIPELFHSLDKILYLDSDVLVLSDLSELFNINLEDHYVAAVHDFAQISEDHHLIGSDRNEKNGFYSGVMLLNLEKIRENNITEKFIETIKKNIDCKLSVQSILNEVFQGFVYNISFLYNACYANWIESKNRYRISDINEQYNTTYNNIYEIKNDIKIMHFSSNLKPWLFYDIPLADEWIRYYFKSPFRNIPLQRISHNKRDVDIEAIKEQVNLLSSKDTYKKIIPIVFSANTEYAPYVAAAIESIYENCNHNCFYEIGILMDSKMPINIRKNLESMSRENIRIKLWNVRNCFENINLYSVGHHSKQMYYKLLIPEIFTKFEKVIYLDCDLIVNRNLEELYNIPLEENYIAATNHFLRSNFQKHVKNRLKLTFDSYYNSGVLVMNTRALLNDNVKSKCFNELIKFKKLPCPDRDIINLACRDKILRLDDRWNFQWHHQFNDATKGDFLNHYKERYQNLLNDDIFIIHYTSSYKPWQYPERYYAEYFWKYLRKTVFYESVLFREIKKANQNNEKAFSSKQIPNNEKIQHLRNEIKTLQNSITFRLAKKLNRTLYVLDAKENNNQEEMEQYIHDITQSNTYKFSALITWIPRKLKK